VYWSAATLVSLRGKEYSATCARYYSFVDLILRPFSGRRTRGGGSVGAMEPPLVCGGASKINSPHHGHSSALPLD